MSRPVNPIRIGIDGGGTTCRFALQLPDKVLRTSLGSANAHSDLQATINVLNAGLSELFEKADLQPDVFWNIPAFAGLAGVTTQEKADQIAGAVKLNRLSVEDDRRSAVAGALKNGNGYVAGVGTGSFLARQDQTGIRFMGGYGADLGDEASGCWLGKELLKRLLYWRDNAVAPSALLETVWSGFDSNLETVLAFGQSARPADFAKFAPQIVDAATSGDPNALALMEAGAQYIIQSLRVLGWQEGEKVCLLGGLASHYRPYLPPHIAANLAQPEGSALDGCLHLAGQLEPIREERVHEH
ncbi:BadF/BadG/BcrA/BcrD ATPase family protein [Roseibium denhamense]|uniref:Glucosamine kinase n=1 Tax=Roseibium denhamense TaxID=76305 RepID=A0ABY1NGP7_9HYPH|nr:BadF/BadG/BcrA/BcrD ATPase family protein [Roseibium denhamense]SMP09275.1 glucosamine kinase [Roseibium denhamense]